MGDAWEWLFGANASLAWWQECARAVVVFAYGLLLVRVAGRRVFGKWSALDIIVSVIIGSNLSRALTGGAALGGTLLATTLIMALHGALAHLAARSAALSALLEGTPIALARNGTLDERRATRAAVSAADLGEALRGQGVQDVAATSLVTLEPSGKINVMKG